MDLIARVAVAAATYTIDKPYDYLVPESLAERARAGVRVTVPFGRGNKASEGVILTLSQESRRAELKALLEVLDSEAVLGPQQIKLALWLRERYFCTLYDAVKALLPAGLWYEVREVCTLAVDRASALEAGEDVRESRVLEALAAHGGCADLETLRQACGETAPGVARELQRRGLVTIDATASRKISDKQARRVSLAVTAEEALAAVEPKRRSAPMRYEVVKLLCAIGSGLASDVCYFTGASPQTLKGLERSGLVAFSQEEVLRVPKGESASGGPIVLSEEQQNAYDGVLALADGESASCALLYGVTGSGKTAVYIRLLQEIVRRGRRGMILVPEIALTPQMMARFSAYFADRVVMLHSGLRMSERYDQWKRIRRGEVDVVLGTRSAVFAPMQNLGMIILDEEHESSYQSENPPRYHARDVAKFLCAQQGAVLVLGSATPSVETTFQAQRGVYQKLILRSRYNQHPLPRVVIADMRQEVRAGNPGMISAPLRAELAENLSRGEQSILFLNRRGSSRMLLCGECGEAPQCPRCSVPLTYHSANGRLMCHYCGHSERAPRVCPECGGLMKQVGAGTQRVEEELKSLFPDAGVLRMDADTVSAGHEALLGRFEKERIPVLLGTQMVAKGLDFENVTLVGVLAADLSLYVDNYHAAERTFSLLTQVVGRAGRGSKDGRAVIQTFTPDNEVITSAAHQDYNSFYAAEIRIRRARRYPPFADIFTLTVSGGEEGAVLRAAAQLREAMRAGTSYPTAANMAVEILGPAPAPVVKVNNRYRYRIFWIGRNDHTTRELIAYYIRAFHQKKENRGMNLFVDCNGEE
ncbi:MAG: primosomal protein N' [Oscillospiraceae bacterium]|nr:primosomal protein N' [Oscillospiraceae bacterium]MCI8714175.1 primosomal protein N' [Oscillospiraceae bacterium]